jgi:large subunit ribosomal protein L25
VFTFDEGEHEPGSENDEGRTTGIVMDATLEVVRRENHGKNESRRLRAAGRIPAVVYGQRKDGKLPEGIPVVADPKAVMQILHSDSGANTLITLKLDGSESRVMVKEYQLDPVTHRLLHADFYQLAMDRAITVTVPVLVKGEAKGVKVQGGMLDFVTRELQVQCLPTDIPEHIDIDVSELMLHQAIRLRELPENPKWKALNDPDTMLVHVVMPKAEEAAAPAEGEVAAVAAPAAPAEPEVIKKGKADKEEEPKK